MSHDASPRRLTPKKPPAEDLTPAQLRVYEEMIEIINMPITEVDQKYNEIPDSFGGKVIGTDAARELSPHYRKSRDGAILYSAVTASPGSAYAQDRFNREVEARGKRKVLLMTAGGPASGKTRSLRDVVDSVDLVMDQNLGKHERAIAQIERAVENGWLVKIVYVYRPFPLAAARVIERADKKGRWSPMDKISEAHRSAQESVVKLWDKYSDHSSVDVRLVANLWTPDKPVPLKDIVVADIRPGGQYHLGNNAFMEEQVRDALKSAREEGKIEQRLLAALEFGTNPAQ